MVVPRNVEDNLPKGTHVVGWPVPILVFGKLLRGFHKVVPYVRQVVSPRECSGGDLAPPSHPLIFLILFILLGQPRTRKNKGLERGATSPPEHSLSATTPPNHATPAPHHPPL